MLAGTGYTGKNKLEKVSSHDLELSKVLDNIQNKVPRKISNKKKNK